MKDDGVLLSDENFGAQITRQNLQNDAPHVCVSWDVNSNETLSSWTWILGKAQQTPSDGQTSKLCVLLNLGSSFSMGSGKLKRDQK